MNSRIVDPRTLWAVLAMELGLALPLISLPAQGDRLVGPLPVFLIGLLLPLGYLGVRYLPALRDPSWRLPCGICLGLVIRAVVAAVPDVGLQGFFVWLGHSVLPIALGVGLWWRGGAVFDAELTAADIRAEFAVLAIIMLGLLGLVRPFVLPDPSLLGGSVGLLAVGGLLATALSRQDAAEAGSPHLRRTLAITTSLLPAGAAVLLVGILRPALLVSMWTTLGFLVELALTPLGLLIAWLLSLFPRREGRPAPPPEQPFNSVIPPPAGLGGLGEDMAWIGTAIVVLLLAAAAVAAIIVARMLLASWIRSPSPNEARPLPELAVEQTGTARGDARAALGWLMRWLRGLVGGRRRPAATSHSAAEAGPADAWAAYQRLLAWAERQGLGRHPAESTGQLQARLVQHAPENTDGVSLVTSTYEWERYGDVHPPGDRLQRVRAALATLVGR